MSDGEGNAPTNPDSGINPGKAARRKDQWDGRLSITVTLASAISVLVLISVGSVLFVGVWLAQRNTIDLLSANANQNIAYSVNRVRDHLRPAEYQAEFIANQIVRGDVDPHDVDTFGTLLTGALAATPQINAISYMDADFQSIQAQRLPDASVKIRTGNVSDDQQIREGWDKFTNKPQWSPPTYREGQDSTFINMAYPVHRNGKLVGVVAAAVSIPELSSFVQSTDKGDPTQRFILYGRDHVLAHPDLLGPYPGRTVDNPLPSVENFSDNILGSIWSEVDRYELELALAEGNQGHALDIGGDQYVYVYQTLDGYGDEPLLVGAYINTSDMGDEIRRLIISGYVGVGALLVALIAAVLLGRRIARPIVNFSEAAGRIRDLEINQISDLPGSIFREIDNQSKAFNAMLHALRWFELYVPRKIVERLIKRDEAGATATTEQEITVLFTDIAGFSTASQDMTAPEVAALVNRHFEILGACIDAEEGTIDKYMGDSVMAFWGAPDPQPDSARRACRAALAMAEAVKKENDERRRRNETPVHIRIGIHTGNATVGNIGAPGRINYTIIGDTVNIGQRLEQLGKVVYPPDTEVAILISGSTAAALEPDFETVAAGTHTLKGRTGDFEVFRLI
ncbi:MAG: hypothetical protein MnENMB40S_31330 [Rhizobiaceae bacterium MnEN-MB40S]|nr:MAG: hypothetical protein MnENMB40S_31330 [Rhizobiaceae bacterium MnEN-MB40S]